MKRSLGMFAFACMCLAISLHSSQAQPSPGGALQQAASDGIDASRGGGYMASFRPPSRPAPKDPGIVSITAARMANNRVRFTFGATRPELTMRYVILWSRPGKEETDMRWCTGAPSEEFIINETPVPDTTYFFVVQAQGKNKDSAGKYYASSKVWKAFHTPAAKPMTAFQPKLTEFAAPAKKTTNPLDKTRVDAQVRLKPTPIIGR